MRPKDWLSMFAAYPKYLRNAFCLWLTHTGNQDNGGFYSRNAFNEYGDVTYKPASGQIDVAAYFVEENVSMPGINDICIDRLNRYNQYVMDQGASLVIAGYPIAYGEYAVFDEEDFSIFQTRLEEMLDCEVISDYTDYFYPYDFFYNTSLHLTQQGAEVRTNQLILDLERWMSGENALSSFN